MFLNKEFPIRKRSSPERKRRTLRKNLGFSLKAFGGSPEGIEDEKRRTILFSTETKCF